MVWRYMDQVLRLCPDAECVRLIARELCMIACVHTCALIVQVHTYY